MIRENFVEELRENLNLSRMEFNEMSQLSLSPMLLFTCREKVEGLKILFELQALRKN